MNDIQVLERAIAVAENMEPTTGYDVLLAAAKRYVRSQRVYPVGGGVANDNRCPSCGQYNAGAHYCTGKPHASDIEYWYNQPTATSPSDVLKHVWPGCDTSKIGAW